MEGKYSSEPGGGVTKVHFDSSFALIWSLAHTLQYLKWYDSPHALSKTFRVIACMGYFLWICYTGLLRLLVSFRIIRDVGEPVAACGDWCEGDKTTGGVWGW